jgi:dTDP-4-amino-4,6-dideoxygalactose transaminase
MNIFREIPPTAGFPLRAKDFLSLFFTKKPQGSLAQDFKNYLNVPYAQVTYSGTAAFYLILESLKALSLKKTIVIPAFICPLLPLAIKRAGFKVALCDIHKDNFNFDIPQLQDLCSGNKDILAIVAVHLGGIPLDFAAIQQIAKNDKIFIVEDCAQSLGAIYKGKMVGTLGEFSFFSLCRGKGLTIYEGGIIVTKYEQFIAKINHTIDSLVKDNFLSEGLKIFELFEYWFFYRPKFFWFVFRLPQIFWNLQGRKLKALAEYFTIDFPIHRVSGLRQLIGHINFGRLDKEVGKQRKNAYDYIEKLKGIEGIKLITEPPGCKASYPYLTLLFNDAKKREKALRLFRNSGLGVFQIYDSPITDYDYMKDIVGSEDCPNARYLAERHITLTTNTFLKGEDIDSIVSIIKKL